MDTNTKARIEELISNMLERIIIRRTLTEPFDEIIIEKNNPFGYRLIPIEIWKGAKFERSFVTSLGQSVFEQVAKIIAQGTGAIAENQHDEFVTINTWRKEKIDELLSLHRGNKKAPNWELEVTEILNLNNNKYEDLKVKFDLYIKRKDSTEEFYSLKTVKPNLDQTEIAKRDMLYMKACKVNSEVFFALPFNPAGEGGIYKSIHSIPYKIFDMDNDECVLIGSGFWNKVGQDENTYSELLEIFSKVGLKYTNIIRNDYLGLNE